MDEESNTNISTRLSRVMDEIGVSEELISFRRHLYLVLDKFWSLSNIIFKHDFQIHIFGSQIEGSTTLGMNSDTDLLFCIRTCEVCVHLSDFNIKKFKNKTKQFRYPLIPLGYLIIKDSTSYPQCCCLQVVDIFGNTPEPVFENMIEVSEQSPFVFSDHHERCLINNNFFQWMYLLSITFDDSKFNNTLNGPALTSKNEFWTTDLVLCFGCVSLPDDCRLLFTRPKPGHWPKQGTLLKLKECEVYVLQSAIRKNMFVYDHERRLGYMQVHYPTDYADMHFRISTNMMERLLMLDLDPVQMKAYIMTKILRKELLSNDVGDSLSTFHMKTALLFTVEQFPEYIWRDDNLVQCVIYCLNTLCRFLKRRYCPHYTIANVNLFVGKLNVYELQILKDRCKTWIHSSLECVQTLHMDNIGKRLYIQMGLNDDTIESSDEMRSDIIKGLMYVIAESFSDLADVSDFDLLSAASTEHPENSSEIKHLFRLVYCARASQRASTCLENDNLVSCDIINMYETSINGSTYIPNYLKYASMLVCSRQFVHANMLLETIENMFISEMEQNSCNANRMNERSNWSTPTEMFMRGVTEDRLVMFSGTESNCVPKHLLYEKCLPMTPRLKIPIRKHVLVAEAIPYLYYLQYLSATTNVKKKHAINKIAKYCYYEHKHKPRDFLYTSFTMFGHLLELSNHIPGALTMYEISFEFVAKANVALLHMCRLYMRDNNTS